MNPAALPDLNANPFSDWVPQGGLVVLSRPSRALPSSAALPETVNNDGWIADHWSLLRQPVFESPAALWQLVLEAGVLPEQWTR